MSPSGGFLFESRDGSGYWSWEWWLSAWVQSMSYSEMGCVLLVASMQQLFFSVKIVQIVNEIFRAESIKIVQ